MGFRHVPECRPNRTEMRQKRHGETSAQ
jgi:hypothetical protein